MATGTDQVLSFAAPKYPIDKVIYRPVTASISLTKNANPLSPVFTTVSITNPVGDYFFVDLQTSLDNSTWYDLGNEPFYFDAVHALSFKQFATYWKMTTTTFTLGFTANQAAITLYYRLVGISKD